MARENSAAGTEPLVPAKRKIKKAARRGLLLGLRRLLGEAYYRATYPGRRWHEQHLAVMERAPIAVLVFHRVADDAANPWTTHTDDFIAAIRWLQQHYEMIALEEVQRRLRAGSNARPSVCITFDDGYADNCRVALPLLIAERIPCTYFVTSTAVIEGRPFRHDLEMGNGHLELNSVSQLRDLSRAGVEIGAHTRTHANLARVSDPKRLHEEIVVARRELEDAVDQPIRYVAFPYGGTKAFSAAAMDATLAAGYAGVCSAFGGWTFPGDDPFHIRRRGVDGPPNRVKNWTLIDPLRNRFLPRTPWQRPSMDRRCSADDTPERRTERVPSR